MKTELLKLKAVLLAIAIACAAQAGVTYAGLPQMHAAQSKDQFVESMFLQIRDSILAIEDLVEGFIKNKTESFSTFINRCQERLNHIEKNILAPLKAELTRVKAEQPGTNYHKILEATFNLAHEMAYKELQTLHSILDNHRKSDKAKNATALVGVLKPHLTKLTSVATLELLDKKLTEIYNLLVLEKYTTVTKELEQLKKMVTELKAKTASMQSKVNIELLPIISAKLKKP